MTIKELRSHIRSHLRRLKGSDQLIEIDYTDDEINSFINEAYRLFLSETELLRDSSKVTLSSGIANLPDGVIRIERVEVGGKPIGRISKKYYDDEVPG